MGIDVQGYVGDPEGQPSANCKVFMFLRSDGSLLGSAVTDETGSYTMTHTGQVDDLVFIVCLDNNEAPDLEGLIYDRITLVDTPEIVVISCDGAVSWLDIYIPNQTVPTGIEITFTLNGGDFIDAFIRFDSTSSTFYDVDNNDITSTISAVLGFSIWDQTDNPVSSEYDGVIELFLISELIEYRVSNLTVVNSALDFNIYSPVDWMQNPTISKNDDGSFNACLYYDTTDEGEEGNTISCDGATSSLTIFPDLPYVATDESDILWQVEIDGILYDESIGPAMAAVEGYNYMEGYLEPNQDTLGITGEAAIGLVITNISATDKRVRLIPDKVFNVESITLSGTPTVSIDESTGIISFCLAAVSA